MSATESNALRRSRVLRLNARSDHASSAPGHNEATCTVCGSPEKLRRVRRDHQVIAEVREIVRQLDAMWDKPPTDAWGLVSVFNERANLAKKAQRLLVQLDEDHMSQRTYDSLMADFRDEVRASRDMVATSAATVHRQEDRKRDDARTEAAHRLAKSSNDLAAALVTWTKWLACATLVLAVATVVLVIVTATSGS